MMDCGLGFHYAPFNVISIICTLYLIKHKTNTLFATEVHVHKALTCHCRHFHNSMASKLPRQFKSCALRQLNDCACIIT